MKAEYDKETDTLTITLRDARVKKKVMKFVPGLLPTSATTVAWSALKFCKPRRWSSRRAKCSSLSPVKR